MNLSMRVARPATRFLAPALLALGLAGAALPAAPPAAAAGTPQLKMLSCTLTPYSATFYKLEYRYTNAGSAASGPFKLHARPVFGYNPATKQFENEMSMFYDHVGKDFDRSLAPGEVDSGTHFVTHKVVQQKTWGIFLDTFNVVYEGGNAQVENLDNACTPFIPKP